jgi:hypothetical protein
MYLICTLANTIGTRGVHPDGKKTPPDKEPSIRDFPP